MEEQAIQRYSFEIAGVVFLLALALASGVLPWAILAGVLALVVAYLFTQDLKQSLTWSLISGGVVAILGIMAMFSPGWYKTLL